MRYEQETGGGFVHSTIKFNYRNKRPAHMKIHRSIQRSRLNRAFALLLGVTIPGSLLLAQSTTRQYGSVDISSSVTAGPVTNAKDITSSSPNVPGELKTETAP